MKNILTSAFLFLAVNAFAQDTKKDSITPGSIEDYGMRIYDPRIRSYMSVDPQQSKDNSPYQFAENNPIVIDTTVTMPLDKPKKKTTSKK